jgi:hypothetical protein
MVGLGRLVMLLGVLLLYGNLSGRLPTVPFAGVVTVATGGVIVALFRDAGRRDETSPRR